MIVIDVGCARYGGDQSIPYLIDEFCPSRLIGLDPAVGQRSRYGSGGTLVEELPVAAWTYDGEIGFEVAGLRGRIAHDAPRVPCVDLAALVLDCAVDDEVVLKMDAEGAEYGLIPHLVERGADGLLKLAWVEYHCPGCGRGGGKEINHMENCREDAKLVARRVEELEASMGCEMHRWNR